MGIFIKTIIATWYIWGFILAAAIFRLFLPKIKGYFGERSVAFFLSRLDPSKYKVINNIMLQFGRRTTQIDHVVVSNYGIFVIETKNYKGWILGNEYDEYWTQVIFKRKEKLRNPIKQNYVHIDALMEALNGQFPGIDYFSIVAFTTNASLKIKTYTDVVYTINLPKTIRKYNRLTISDSDKERIYSKLNSLNIDTRENRKAHVRAIKSKINRPKSNICPKCGGNLVLRNGKYGQFMGCGNFPRCRFIAK
jgi:hypothetical protein